MLTPSIPAVQDGKVFLVLRGELEFRFDALFYAEKPDTGGFIKVGSFVNVKGGKRVPKGMGYSEEETEFLYLRVDDIDEFGNIKFDNIKYLPQEVFDILEHYELCPNEVVISIAGTIGKITLLKENKNKRIILTENAAKLIIRTDRVLPEYLKILLELPIVQKQMQLSYIQTTIPKLALERIANLKIPEIPPLNIQQQIIAKFEAAYAAKRAKEAEAASLLASIDGYFLEQLGITLPEVAEKKKVFFVCSDKVSGGRFDPKLYLPSTRELIDCLFSTKYQYKPLKHLITHSVSGDWGIENFEEGFEECLVIRATEFDNRYNLRLENSRVKYRFIAKTKLQKLDIQPNDLLIEKSGGSIDQPVGRIAILTKELTQGHKLAFSNFVHKIRLSADVNSDFAYFYLNTLHSVKVTDVMQSQTNGIRNLIMKEYFNLPIPLPSIEIQTNIAAHITAIRSQAQQLETEAKATVEAAKKEVEAMILGEGGGGV